MRIDGAVVPDSPVLTGDPQAPTPPISDNDTSIATTAFVKAQGYAAQSYVDAADASMLKYSVQTLTSAQKAQARANIDVLKRNYIVNGAMQISQENGTTAGAASGTGYYAVDCFACAASGTTGAANVQQIALVTPGGSPNRLLISTAVADAAVAAGDILFIECAIEGLRAADLRFGSISAKTVTIQFGVKAPTGTYCVTLLNRQTNRSFVSEYVIAAGENNIDTLKSVTIPGDTLGTWDVDTQRSIIIRWGLMAGATYQQAAGSWGTTNAIGSSNQFNFMSGANVFHLFDVGLYEGAVAPTFQVPDYASELTLCQRYYQNMTAGHGGYSLAATAETMRVQYPVPMRATPTITPTFSLVNSSGGTVDSADGFGFRFFATVTATGSYQVTLVSCKCSARA